MIDTTKNRIFGLDLMRAIAILMVLSSHSLWIYPPSSNLISQICQLFGYWGVEIFFVLSGFLIGRILFLTFTQTDFKFAEVIRFLKRRWFRTLPNYFLVLLLNFAVAFLIGYSIESGWSYFLFLQNFSSPMLPFFTESWSLSIEEFAYVLFPTALLTITMVVKPANKSTFFLLLVLGFIVFFLMTKVVKALYFPMATVEEWNLGIKSVVIFRLDAIFVGILFSWISLNFFAFWKKCKLFFAFLGLCLMAFLFAVVGYFQLTFDTYPFFWHVFYLPLTSLTFAFFLPFFSDWKFLKWAFFQKIIIFISIISYSIYLLHYGIVLQLMKYFFPTDGMPFNSLHFYTLVYLLITITLSYVCYRFYEKPMTNLRDK